MAIFQISFKAK